MLKISFIILALQNLLILLSFNINPIPIEIPYFIDLIGFTLLGAASLLHYINEQDKNGILASVTIIGWVIIRIYLQFFYFTGISIDSSQPDTEVLQSLSTNLSVLSIFLLINAILLTGFAIFTQLTTDKNIVFVFMYVITNLLAAIMIFEAFNLRPNLLLEEKIGASALGLVLKTILVPFLGVIAFLSMLNSTEEIYNISASSH